MEWVLPGSSQSICSLLPRGLSCGRSLRPGSGGTHLSYSACSQEAGGVRSRGGAAPGGDGVLAPISLAAWPGGSLCCPSFADHSSPGHPGGCGVVAGVWSLPWGSRWISSRLPCSLAWGRPLLLQVERHRLPDGLTTGVRARCPEGAAPGQLVSLFPSPLQPGTGATFAAPGSQDAHLQFILLLGGKHSGVRPRIGLSPGEEQNSLGLLCLYSSTKGSMEPVLHPEKM